MIINLVRFSRRLLSSQSQLLNTSKQIFSSINQFSTKLPVATMERTIAIGQMCATNDKMGNRNQVSEIVKSAANQNACVSCLFKFDVQG